MPRGPPGRRPGPAAAARAPPRGSPAPRPGCPRRTRRSRRPAPPPTAPPPGPRPGASRRRARPAGTAAPRAPGAAGRPAPARRAASCAPTPPARPPRRRPGCRTASARSKPLPALRRLAGDRASTMRSFGQLRPELVIAARTRSLASCSAASGSPTSWNRGSPPPTSASISTTWPCTPSRATDQVRASPIRTPPGSAARWPDGRARRARPARRTGPPPSAPGGRPARPA